MWDQIIKWAAFLASLGTLLALFFLIPQIRLARSSLNVAKATLDEEKAERKRQRENQRRTILESLRTEIVAVRNAAEGDLKRFQPSDYTDPRVKKAGHDMGIEKKIGDMAYYRSFVWTLLPTSTIEETLQEADLLGLQKTQVEDLQSLRLRILRANSLVPAKTALLPVLVQIKTAAAPGQSIGVEQTQAQPGIEQYYRWVDMRMDRLNEDIQSEFTDILNDCNKITQWLNSFWKAAGTS